MSQKKNDRDRITLDITGLRDEVSKAYDTPAWKNLSLSGQIRTLVEERLKELEKSRNEK